MTGGHPVGDLRGEYGLDLVPVQPDADSLRRPVGGQRAAVVTQLETRLRETHPVAATTGLSSTTRAHRAAAAGQLAEPVFASAPARVRT